MGMVFFTEMSILIKTGVRGPLKAFVENGRVLQGFRQQDKDISNMVSKETIYEIAYKASKTAFVVNRRADAYHQISDNHIMPVLNRLSKLIALSDFDEMNKERNKIEAEMKDTHKAIEQIIRKSRNDFNDKIEAKIAEMEETFKANVPSLPRAEERKLETRVKKSVEDIIDYSEWAKKK